MQKGSVVGLGGRSVRHAPARDREPRSRSEQCEEAVQGETDRFTHEVSKREMLIAELRAEVELLLMRTEELIAYRLDPRVRRGGS